jgi:hypothetical protein
MKVHCVLFLTGAQTLHFCRGLESIFPHAWSAPMSHLPPAPKSSRLSEDHQDAARRRFVKSLSLLAAAGFAGGLAPLHRVFAETAAHVSESDPMAVSLGYKNDTRQVDQKKFAKHDNAQTCGKCQFYSGSAGSTSGPCQIFQGKLVQASGWCSAFAPKA